MNQSLTIVLPVHNGESQLRANVHEILELAGELTDRFRVLIVDDGSVDDTFEVASELAAEFPQVFVHRHSCQSGWGTALDAVRARLQSDIVVVHDGVTPLNAGQLRKLWQQHARPNDGRSLTAESTNDRIEDLAAVSQLQSTLSRAHRRIMGLMLMPSLAHDDGIDGVEKAPADRPGSKPSRRLPADSVGRIPALPRPNYLKAIADFALGE